MVEKSVFINNSARIEYVDALKGFAIFTVIWGHSIEYLKNGYDCFQDPIFEFIYSFHMPLFFMISGFFFRSSLKLKLKEFLLNKSVQLILPIVVWAVLFFLIGFLSNFVSGKAHDFSNRFEVMKLILVNIRDNWFLRELFFSFCIVYVTLKLFKKEWLACILSMSFVLIFPFLCGTQRVFLPVFWAGFFLKDYYYIFKRYANQLLLITGSIFVVCLMFWDGYYTMYTSGFPSLINFHTLIFNFTNIDISIFRLFIGICGSLFFFTLFEIMYSDNMLFRYLTKIGINTLAIYLIQRLLLEKWANELIDFPNMNLWVYNLLVTPLFSVIILLFCFLLIKIVQKNKYAELLLFGKK